VLIQSGPRPVAVLTPDFELPPLAFSPKLGSFGFVLGSFSHRFVDSKGEVGFVLSEKRGGGGPAEGRHPAPRPHVFAPKVSTNDLESSLHEGILERSGQSPKALSCPEEETQL